MNMQCTDRERIFLDGTPEEWAALETHAESCAECAEDIRAWKNLSVAASEMHEEWDSPSLWPKIQRALAEQASPKESWIQKLVRAFVAPSLSWQTAAAALLLAVVTGSGAWMIWHKPANPLENSGALLKDRAISRVERAEAEYIEAIEKLDQQARPQLENPATPLVAAYREKLLVLDSAITDLRAQAGVNPGNAHLRRQLLAMYQEKQETLEQVLEAKP